MRMNLLGAAALGLLVAACGTDPRERTTGGAAAGAATGAGIGALGGPVGALAGAAIGGGAGAVTGAVTEPRDVNLGRPVWRDPEVRVPGVREGGGRAGGGAVRVSAETMETQRALSGRGYDVGPVDGISGPRTDAALREFQRDQGIPATGRADPRTRQALNIAGASDTRTGTDGMNRGTTGGGMPRDSMGNTTGGNTTGGNTTRGNTTGGTTTGGNTVGGNTTGGNVQGGGTLGGGGSNAVPGNTGARGELAPGAPGVGGTLGGGRGTPGVNASPDNPATGSNSAGSSSQ